MNKRPGHVEVTVETGYCSFCDRVRNLRREEHHLGTLVRTVITCETCHRTLSSTMGVAAAEAPVDEAAATPATPEVAPAPRPKKQAKPAAAKKVTPPTPKPKAAKKATPATPKAKATKARTTKSR